LTLVKSLNFGGVVLTITEIFFWSNSKVLEVTGASKIFLQNRFNELISD
jgi:hypothetical protein